MGADAISCIDSVGPGLTIDIKTGEPVLGSLSGVGNLSGPAIRPLAIYQVHSLAQVVKIPVIGIGGIMRGNDAVEMLMAGARAVGVCTVTILKGLETLGEIAGEVALFMEEYGYNDVEDLVGLALRQIEERKRKGMVVCEGIPPKVILEKCNKCGVCVRGCPYYAITLNDTISIDPKLCYGCGLCSTMCPTNAIIRPY